METKTLDDYGVMGQIQADGSVEGGDSLCWNGHAFVVGAHVEIGKFVDYINSRYHPVVMYNNFFLCPFLVRHPWSQSKHSHFSSYSNGVYDGCLSRDQLTGFLGANAIHKTKVSNKMVGDWIEHYAFRGFLFTNNTIVNGADAYKHRAKRLVPRHPGLKWFLKTIFTKPIVGNFHADHPERIIPLRKAPDLTLSDIWALTLRAYLTSWWSKALWYIPMCVFDLVTLVSTLTMFFKIDNKKDDVMSHFTKSYVGMKVIPTPTMWLNWKMLDKEDMFKKLTSYWTKRKQSFILKYYKTAMESV